jgi:hypothetical protein
MNFNEKGITSTIFKKLVERNEAARFIDYLFKRQFEGIDFSYVETLDIYLILCT